MIILDKILVIRNWITLKIGNDGGLIMNLGFLRSQFVFVEFQHSTFNPLQQESSTRGQRAACGPRASFVRPGKGISQNTMRYKY